MVFGGLLQVISEIQRYVFKQERFNAGKLHTGGLFRYARFINSTAHVLRDIGAVILTGNIYHAVPFVIPDYLLLTSICAKETVAYMRLKYKLAYTKYEQETEALFIPGIW